jgi:hypothetical protein
MKLLLPLLVTLGLILVSALLTANSVFAANAQVTCVFVPEAGHNIQGPFWAYYSAHSGVENFGLPITEAFVEKGIVVQYFTRARFEYRPEYPEPYRVQLGLLGTLYGITDPPLKSTVIPRAGDPNFAYFNATGLLVPTTLKKYFDAHGGWEVFGYPVSMVRYEGKSFAQYFQRARLEWYVVENKVVPSPVGQIALDKSYPSDFQWRTKTVNDWCSGAQSIAVSSVSASTIGVPTPVPANASLNVQVKVRFRQPGANGPQYVDVSVTDANGKPMQGIASIATIHLSNYDRVFPLLATDAAGKTSFSFDVGSQSSSAPTVVQVKAYSGSTTATGQDSFTR